MSMISNRHSLAIAALATSALLTGGQAQAATLVNPYGSDGPGTGLQTKLNTLVTPAAGDTWNPGTLSVSDYDNGTVKNGQSALDVLWNLAGAQASATIVLEIAGNAGNNTFGFYDSTDSTKKAQLFAGAASSGSKVYVKFNGTTLQSSADNVNFSNVSGGGFGSTTFGFYLQGPAGTFYSDPTLNGGKDNLVAYQGFDGRKLSVAGNPTDWDSKSFVLGWEDLNLSNSDKDYNDLVLLVSQITPVPEPSTYVAGALLLIPVLVQVRRRMRA